MPDSRRIDPDLPADLIEEVGRFNAVREVLRIMLTEPVRRWSAGIRLDVRVLFA